MPDNLTLGLLPERKRNWRNFAASYGLEILLLLFLLGLRLVFPDTLQFRRTEITELVPPPAPEPTPMKVEVQKPTPAPIRLPVPVTPPKLVVPKEVIAQPKKLPEPPKIEAEFKAPQLQPAKVVVPKVVYTGTFGNSAPATVSAPIQKVQTGGFGDPNGLPGAGKENSHLASASLGSFDLPPGAGKGNGSGGSKGVQGVIASAGFGNGVAIGDGRNNSGAVQSAGFGAQELGHTTKQHIDDGPPTTPVEITSKPNPAYTDEARQLKIEGEVLLEVMFGANGQLHVNRVVRGLGHGLDEAAVAAASKMQFKPALRNGSAVDSTSIVHVIFQLAY
ncbi:MAG: energy transducer TonB [Acidobacteriaceae bacterium]|nr:energy transducer TonB [Acidobacteriaceae bacterium]